LNPAVLKILAAPYNIGIAFICVELALSLLLLVKLMLIPLNNTIPNIATMSKEVVYHDGHNTHDPRK
jgi:hypothetical protein